MYLFFYILFILNILLKINMEKNNSKEQDEITKNLNEEELVIYKYLNGDNKSIIKTDLETKISELKKVKDSIPKIDEKEQILANNLIKQYFEEKENKNIINLPNEQKQKPNIIYSLENLLNEKENIEKKIKDKKEAVELLKELENLIKTNKISQNLKQKIDGNSYLCRNQELKDYLEQINKNKNKFHEKEDLTEEQKIIVSFRNIIKNSFQEAKDDSIEEISILQLYQELKFENIDIKKIVNENEGNINTADDNIFCKDEKIMEFKNIIKITPSFLIFIKEINNKYNPFINNNKNNINIFYKLINLLISRYNYYFSNLKEKMNENDEKIKSLIVIHNNLELFTYLLNYYILFYNNENNNNNENLNQSLINIVIKIKNLSISMFSEVIASFISDLMNEMEEIESFENISKDKFFNFSLQKIQKTIKKIFTFFDKLRVIAIHREIIFQFDFVLSNYFDSFNQKILRVKNYDLLEIQALLKLSKDIINNMKNNLEQISSQNMDLSVKFMNILEQNLNYLKFQEILNILNFNLAQIKNYIINNNYFIYISKDQLINLINSTFSDSEKKTDTINFINENVKTKNK